MTVESQVMKVRYEGNGVSVEFPTQFAFLENGHVRAVLRRPEPSIPAGYEDLELILDTDYGLGGGREIPAAAR